MDHNILNDVTEGDSGLSMLPQPMPLSIAPANSNPISIAGPAASTAGFTRNKSGHKGIFQKGEKWEVQVRRLGKLHYFGRYLTMESAVEALRAFESGQPVPVAPCKAAPGSSGVKGINKSRNGKWVAYSQPTGGANETSTEIASAIPLAVGGSSSSSSSSSSSGSSSNGNVGSRGKQAKYLGVFNSVPEAQQAIADYQQQGLVHGLTNRQTHQKENDATQGQVRAAKPPRSDSAGQMSSGSERMHNGANQTSAASGVKGITKASGGKWRVTGQEAGETDANGKSLGQRHYLGTFDDIEDAKARLTAFHNGEFAPRAMRESYVAKGIKKVELKLSGAKYQASGMKKGKKTEATGMRVLGNYDTLEEAQDAVTACKENREIPKPTQKKYGEPRMQSSSSTPSAIPGGVEGVDTDEVGDKRGRASSSGILGVTKRKDDWMARFVDDEGVRHYLGTFKTKDDAAAAIMAYRSGAPLPKKARGRPALPKNQKQGNNGPGSANDNMPMSVMALSQPAAVTVPAQHVMPSVVMPATNGGRPAPRR